MRQLTALLLLLGLAACGKDESRPSTGLAMSAATSPNDDDIAALVPDGANAIIRFRSLDAADAFVAEISNAAGASMMMGSIGDQVAMMTGVREIDRSKPLALAVTFSGGSIPAMTFIVPASDPAAAASGYQRGGSAVRSGYAALSMLPDYQPGASTLGKGLPAGDIAARFDLAAILPMYRDVLDTGLGQLPGLREMLDGAESLDLAASLRDGVFDLKMAYVGRDEAEEGRADLAGLARLLPRDFPFVMLLHFDLGALVDALGPMAAMFAGPQQGLVQEQMGRMRALADLVGDDWLFAFDVAADGMRAVFAARAPDSRAAVEQYLASVPSATLEKKRMLGDVPVHRLRVPVDATRDADLARLYGDEGLRLDLAALDGRMVVVVGGDGLTQEVLGSSRPPAGVDSALSAVPGNARFLLRIEMRALAKGVAALKGGSPVPDGVPVPLLVYGSAEGGVVRGGLRFHLKNASDLMKSVR